MDLFSTVLAPVLGFVRRLFPKRAVNVNRAGDGGSITIHANRIDNAGTLSAGGGAVAPQDGHAPAEQVLSRAFYFSDQDLQKAQEALLIAISDAVAETGDREAFLSRLEASVGEMSNSPETPLTEARVAILQTMYEWLRTLIDHHGDPEAQAESLRTFEAISVAPRSDSA